MFDPDFEENAPYDNVEFPVVRKPGTGTWPGPGAGTGGSGTGSAGPKLFGHPSGRATISGGAPKLAPLVEVEGGSESNEKLHNLLASSTPQTNGSSTLNGSTTSVSSSASSYSQSAAKQQTARSQFLASKPPGSPTRTGKTSPSVEMPSSPPPPFITTPTTTAPPSSINNIRATPQTTTTAPGTTTTAATTASSTTKSSTSTTSTTNTTKSSSPATSASGQGEKTASKPVIKYSNDNNLYMPTEVTGSDGTKKKAPRGVAEVEDDDFKRQDLNPGSRRALEGVYTDHDDFYQLNSKVLDEGGLLKQDVLDIYRKTGETLTYEQLLQGMLVDGERFLLGSCWLYFTHVQFLDLEATKVLREPYGKGRIGLTSKRALFLSTETYTDASLEQFETGPEGKRKPKKKQSRPGYKLEVSKRSSVIFKNIPLSNFHSAEMEIVTGTAAQTKITRKLGCCACVGLPWGTQWVSTTPMTRSIASRVLRVGVSMPPWQTRMFMDIHLDPAMSLTVARDFISQLHAFAPHMH